MRITWLALIAFMFASLAPHPVLAQKVAADQKVAAEKPSTPRYDTCTCRFGYGEVCITTVSCDSNGGKCVGTCTLPPYETPTNR